MTESKPNSCTGKAAHLVAKFNSNAPKRQIPTTTPPPKHAKYSHDKGNHSLDWASHSKSPYAQGSYGTRNYEDVFSGGEKTTNNQGGGERKVRNDPHKEQRTVGFIGRLSCNQHNDKGVQTIFQINLGSNTTTSSDSNFFHKKQLRTSNNSFRLLKREFIREIIISTRLHFSRIFIRLISGELKLRRTMIFVCRRTNL